MATYRRDLTEGGTYFFTLALQDRSKDWLTRYINELRAAFIETQQRYPFKTIAICILPDHIHLIMELPENDHRYAARIRLLKTLFSQKIPAHCRMPNQSQRKRGDLGIWQRRFWEHLIRNEQDLSNHWDYIYYNPVKHGYVSSVKDWPYSSFHRDVTAQIYPLDWGGDISVKIQNLYQE